jgi:nuclease S1
MLRTALLVIMLALFPAAGALGWSELGHRVVAELAERQLCPTAREEAQRLLASVDEQRLADIASWADRVRELPEYAESRPMHYVNLATDCSYQPQQHCPDGACIVMAIERFQRELGDAELADDRRAEALKFLVHFVGDLHQPMHAGFAHDRGGNLVPLSLDGRDTNLHSVWDHDLPAMRGLDFEAYATALATPGRIGTGSMDPAQWAQNACALIGAHSLEPTDHRLGSDYLQRHLPLAEAQLRLAGARLAVIIERALGQ